MGVVYAARDLQRRETIALKTLHQGRDGRALYNFKREFRTLADVAHHNLVSLYELVADEEQCFFTMELVDGIDFMAHVRPVPEQSCLIDRLRAALEQLVHGVMAIHGAGKLHRDLKPSNVLVTPEGRVVILDFGMATDQETLESQSLHAGFGGTIAYMAPEQADGQAASAASDWYAVGTMLFEALAGRLPFVGGLGQILGSKIGGEAPDPTSVTDEPLPEDLVALCNALLAREAEDRPDGSQILEILGKASAEAPMAKDLAERALIGRSAELASLVDAYNVTLQGFAVSLYVHGTSGMGKTALIRAFLRRLTGPDEGAVVLTGQCYEREVVTYKALDGVIDSLSKYLDRLDRPVLEALIPPDIHALTRLFPVLLRVDFIERTTRGTQTVPDRLTLRKQAFEALRELLRRIAARHALVLHIDDLQWADADSAALLQELLRDADPPPLLLIASFRTEEIHAQPFLQELLRGTGTETQRELTLGPLGDPAATALVTALLGDASHLEVLHDNIVREAAGNPFFIEQLAGYANVSESTLSSLVNLSEMLEYRIRQLPAGAGPLLDVLTVAARPLEASLLFRAARLEGDERPLIGALRAAGMVRSSGSADSVELYHDRIRVSLGERLDPARTRDIHRRLAETLITHGQKDPQILYEHFLGAGDERRAAREALRAARQASSVLAFERAARLYARALELGDYGDELSFELIREQADCLANAGRPSDAAEAFLRAAQITHDFEALECRHLAAREYLGGAHFDDGIRLIRQVLMEIGMTIPDSTFRATLALLWQRFRLRLRGLDFDLRDSGSIDPQRLLRIDVCWMVASSLVTVKPVQAAIFQTRQLRLALDAGDIPRIARALAIETSFVARQGVANRRRVERLNESCLRVASQSTLPFVQGISTLHTGVSAYLMGDWRRGLEACDASHGIFRDQCTGAWWEQITARRYALGCLTYLGDLGEVRRRVRRQLHQAKARGNFKSSTELRTRASIAWLAADDPEGSIREIDDALQSWDGFHLTHYNAFWGRNQADLYQREIEAAWHRLGEVWPQLEKTLLLRIQILRVEAQWLRGRTALASADVDGRLERLALAETCANQLGKEGAPYAEVMAHLLHAGIAHVRGEGVEAQGHLRSAMGGSERSDLGLHAAAARFQCGRLLEGEVGIEHRNSSELWMRNHGILEPTRMAAMVVPGFSRL